MDNFTWVDVIKILIPILVVIIAGSFALYRMRLTAKLEALSKWRDSYREHISGFQNGLLEFAAYANDKITNDPILRSDYIDQDFKIYNRKLIHHFTALNLLLDNEVENEKKLYTMILKMQKQTQDAILENNIDKIKDLDFTPFTNLVKAVYLKKDINSRL